MCTFLVIITLISNPIFIIITLINLLFNSLCHACTFTLQLLFLWLLWIVCTFTFSITCITAILTSQHLLRTLTVRRKLTYRFAFSITHFIQLTFIFCCFAGIVIMMMMQRYRLTFANIMHQVIRVAINGRAECAVLLQFTLLTWQTDSFNIFTICTFSIINIIVFAVLIKLLVQRGGMNFAWRQ